MILLSLLSTSARTGYDVRKWLDRHGAYVGYSAQTSQIYRQLGKLVDREWAVPVPDPRDSGPDAKLYQITEEGRRKLQEWIDSPYEPPLRPLDPDFQVRLRFAGTQSPEKALELVRTELQFRQDHRQNHLIVIESSRGRLCTGRGRRRTVLARRTRSASKRKRPVHGQQPDGLAGGDRKSFGGSEPATRPEEEKVIPLSLENTGAGHGKGCCAPKRGGGSCAVPSPAGFPRRKDH